MNGDTMSVHDDLRTEGGSVPIDFDALKTLPGLRAVDNWTLDADEGLLEFLKGFSDRMLTRMNQVHDQVDELVYETKASEARLYNTFNEFIMLSNTQFIENRIYEEDFDMQAAGQSRQEQSKQQDQVQEYSGEKKTSDEQAGQNFSAAIKYGLKALEVCSVPLEDDDMYLDDEGSFNEEQVQQQQQQQRTQAMDLINVESHYKQQTAMLKERTLPFIIGSTEFFEDDMVGLNVDEENQNVVEGIGEDYNNALGNVSDSMASSGSIPPPPPPPPMMGSGNIPPPPPLPNFGAPANNNLTAPPPFKLESTSNLFGEDNEDDNLFGVPSSSENMFGGSDTTGAHESHSSEPQETKPKKPMDIREQLALAMANKFQKPAAAENREDGEQHAVSHDPASNNFNDDGDDGGLFGSSKSDPFGSSLFGADSTSVSKQKSTRDDDIFDLGELEASISGGKSSSSTAAKSKKETQPAKVGFAFDFEDDTGDSLFGGDDIDILAKPKPKSATTTETNKKAPQKSSNSLFGFDDDEDDFDSILTGTKKEAPKAAAAQTQKSSPQLTSATRTKSSSIFGLDDEDDDFLSSAPATTKKTPEPSKPTASTQPKKPASTLFGFDDDEDDLDFGTIGAKKTETKKSEPETKPAKQSPATTAAPKQTSSLFQDDEEDDDFNFVSKDREVKKPDPKDTPKHQAAKKMSMWDDEDDDLDILATPVSKKTESAPAASKTPESIKKEEIAEQKPKVVTIAPPKVDEDTESSSTEEETVKTVKPSAMNKSAFAASIMKGLNLNVGGGPTKTITRIRSESRPEAPQPSLLDHDSLESPDPFDVLKVEEKKKIPSPAKESLFSDEPKQPKVVAQPTVATTKIPKGAVSMFGGPVTTSAPKATVVKEQKNNEEQPKKEGVTNFERDGGSGQTLTHMSLARPKRSKRQPAKKAGAKPSVSLPSATTTTPTPAPVTATTKKSSLFDDDDLDEFVPKASVQPKEVKPLTPVQPQKKSSLFDDDDEEFNFAPKKATEQPKPAVQKVATEPTTTKEALPPANTTKSASLFGESDDEDIAPLPSKKKPESAKSDSTSNSTPVAQVTNHDDILIVAQKETAAPVEEIKPALSLPQEETTTIEQLPVSEPTPTTNVEAAKIAQETSQKVEEDFVLTTSSSTQKSFSSKKKTEAEEKKKKASSLFPDDDDLMASIPTPKKQEATTTSNKQQTAKSNANDLINDLLSGVESKKATTKKPAAKVSAIDSDLFSSVPTTKKPAAKKAASSATTVDDLLQATTVPKKATTAAKKPATTASDLFGDLSASKSTKNTSAAKKTAAKKAASTAAKGLFDGDDDIFAAPVAKKASTTTKKPAAKKVDTSGLFDF